MGNEYLEKRKASGPFLPKWSQVKGRHKVLSNGNIFKPDITAVINRYDQCLKDYDDLIKEQEKLKDIIRELGDKGSEAGAQRDQTMNEVDKLTKSFEASMKQSSAQLAKNMEEPAKAVEILTDIVDQAEGFLNERKGQWQKLDSGGNENLQRFKKARDEYKKKADAAASEMKKLEDSTYKAAEEIGGVLVDYMNIASDVDHDEVIKDIKALASKF